MNSPFTGKDEVVPAASCVVVLDVAVISLRSADGHEARGALKNRTNTNILRYFTVPPEIHFGDLVDRFWEMLRLAMLESGISAGARRGRSCLVGIRLTAHPRQEITVNWG